MVSGNRVIRCGKRVYYSHAAQSLVDTTHIQDPVAATEHLAYQLLTEVGIGDPPVPLQILASFQGVAALEILDMPQSGRLIPMPDGKLKVQLRISDSPGRQNFSLGHEIGHTLMPGYCQQPVEKIDLHTGEFVESNEEEFFCDVAARSLLLPETLFRSRCSERAPSIDNLLALAEEFSCSLEAVALRLDQLRPWPCTAIVWEMQLKPVQARTQVNIALPGFEEMSVPQEEYRVKYHAGRNTSLFFPAFRHVSSDCDMVTGCLAETYFKGECLLPTATREVGCYVEAVVVPYRDEHLKQRSRIITLAFIDGESVVRRDQNGGLPIG